MYIILRFERIGNVTQNRIRNFKQDFGVGIKILQYRCNLYNGCRLGTGGLKVLDLDSTVIKGYQIIQFQFCIILFITQRDVKKTEL